MQLGTLEQVAGKEDQGVSVVSDAVAGVAISCYITAELEAEGMAREIVHRVQTLRRSAGYDIADHIVLYYEADAFIMQSLSSFADYVMQETLARAIEDAVPDDVDLKEEFKVSGYQLVLGIKKAD
jgi:isoleucyl-tRNA synthetase